MIFKIINNLKMLFFGVLLIIFSSCTDINPGINKTVSISKEVNFNNGFNVLLKINPNLNFASKAVSSSSGAPPKSLADIKSYTAFLTTNYADPFATGTNPFGDGVVVSTNYSTGAISVLFVNVPSGGPYVAVVAAFDDKVENSGRKNITKADPTITSGDKQWCRSGNGVLVQNSGKLIFTDNSAALNATLNLLEPIATQIGSTINIDNGSSNTVGFVNVN